tara:strand:+ start:29145 stop:30206 length:1062 start_codon:yes stop_codon:yes gene_type:complete
MALESSGHLSIGGSTSNRSINLELGRSATATSSLGESDLRTLANKPSGAITLPDDFYGKANAMAASGGNAVFTVSGFKLHVFTSPGNFVVTGLGPGTVQYLIVAGGGGGAANNGGGGGAGGVLWEPTPGSGYNLPATGTYPVIVGAGGDNPVGLHSRPGVDGSPSSVFGLTAVGGGGGGSAPGVRPSTSGPRHGRPGGSGGGGTRNNGAGGTATTGQGYPGGVASGPGSNTQNGGGGGGAGEAGNTNGVTDGGDGIQVPWVPTSYGSPGRYFAGGGGGGAETYGWGGGNGGLGGGGGGGGTPGGTPGSGGSSAPPKGDSAVANTGGGGGGEMSGGNDGHGDGGSGIVILRYPV